MINPNKLLDKLNVAQYEKYFDSIHARLELSNNHELTMIKCLQDITQQLGTIYGVLIRIEDQLNKGEK